MRTLIIPKYPFGKVNPILGVWSTFCVCFDISTMKQTSDHKTPYTLSDQFMFFMSIISSTA